MKFFKAEVIGKEEDCWPVGGIDEWGIVYEQVKKRAVIQAVQPRNRRGGWMSSSGTFPVNVFCRSNRASAEEARQLVMEACAIWEVDGIGEVVVRDAAINDEFESLGVWGFGGKELLQKGDLFELGDFVRARDVYHDWVVDGPTSQKDCIAAARGTAYSEALAREIGRMFETSAAKGAAGAASAGGGARIPVHYLFEGCDRADSESALDVLLGALHLAGRLPSAHAICLNLDNVSNSRGRDIVERFSQVDDVVNAALASALSGNVLVIEYGRHDHDSEYDELPYRCFGKLLDEMRPYFDDTLIVFAIPQNRPDLARRVKKMAGRPLVEIAPDEALDARGVSVDEARAYLEQKAADAGLATEGSLWEMLEERMEDASFSDLDWLLDDWRLSQLVADEFPAYRAELQESLDLRRLQKPDGLAQLDELIGLSKVKQQIRDILARIRMNQEAARLGLPVQTFSKHMAFVGSPGTGKTEVARLFGRVLREANALPEGRVVTVSGSDIGPGNVESVFDSARGSVLFVDEAYAMSYWAIADFIALMENRRDDTVVILAGYEDAINWLLSCNQGFRSRLGFVLRFPDYKESELLQIFELMCSRAQLELPEDARRVARDLLARNGRRPDQGNGRYVRKLFEDSLGTQQVRLAQEWESVGGDRETALARMRMLQACDIEKAGDLSGDEVSAREELGALIGLANAKRLVNEFIDFMCMQKLRRDRELDADSVPMHMAFTGAPGTGKTEVARLLGRILRDEGILSVGGFHEATGSSFVKPHAGEGAKAVRDLFQEARGSVIFIDEAYGMAEDMGGGSTYTEAATELIAQMESYRDEVVVILAGYSEEIDKLLKSNPGFESRVRIKVDFPDYSVDELCDIFDLMAGGRKLTLGDGVREKVRDIMGHAVKVKDFGNARFARNLLESALLRQGSRLAAAEGEPTDAELMELLPADIEWEPPAEGNPLGFAA